MNGEAEKCGIRPRRVTGLLSLRGEMRQNGDKRVNAFDLIFAVQSAQEPVGNVVDDFATASREHLLR